jgi:hypothetical protein
MGPANVARGSSRSLTDIRLLRSAPESAAQPDPVAGLLVVAVVSFDVKT